MVLQKIWAVANFLSNDEVASQTYMGTYLPHHSPRSRKPLLVMEEVRQDVELSVVVSIPTMSGVPVYLDMESDLHLLV